MANPARAIDRIRLGLERQASLLGTAAYEPWRKKAEPLFATLTRELVEETFGPCQPIQRSEKEALWDRVGAEVYRAGLVGYTRALCRLNTAGPVEKSKPKKRGRKKKTA